MIKLFLIPMILLSISFAAISEVDNKFIDFSKDNVNKNTSDKELANEVNTIQAQKDTNNLNNNEFDLETYKKELGESYEEAFKNQAKKNIDQQLSKYKDLPEVKKLKEDLYSMVDKQSIDQMKESFSGMSYSIKDPNDSDSTIQVFNGDEVSSDANSASKSKDTTIRSFSCLCAGELTAAFMEFDNYYTLNLTQLHNQLKALNSSIEKNTIDLTSNFKNREVLTSELVEQNVLLQNWIEREIKTKTHTYLKSN